MKKHLLAEKASLLRSQRSAPLQCRLAHLASEAAKELDKLASNPDLVATAVHYGAECNSCYLCSTHKPASRRGVIIIVVVIVVVIHSHFHCNFD